MFNINELAEHCRIDKNCTEFQCNQECELYQRYLREQASIKANKVIYG